MCGLIRAGGCKAGTAAEGEIPGARFTGLNADQCRKKCEEHIDCMVFFSGIGTSAGVCVLYEYKAIQKCVPDNPKNYLMYSVNVCEGQQKHGKKFKS